MATRKKAITPKQAATGRQVKCRTCYLDMKIQLRLDGGQDYWCEKCGRIWPIPRLEIK